VIDAQRRATISIVAIALHFPETPVGGVSVLGYLHSWQAGLHSEQVLLLSVFLENKQHYLVNLVTVLLPPGFVASKTPVSTFTTKDILTYTQSDEKKQQTSTTPQVCAFSSIEVSMYETVVPKFTEPNKNSSNRRFDRLYFC